MITVACVWNGNKYGLEYVTKLRAMVLRHLKLPHKFVCYTDRPNDLPDHIEVVPTKYTGWWAKMELFDLERRDNSRILYFDLDTVITGDLEPLARWDGEFGICQNFTQLAGHQNWPCRYGSCVMSIAPLFGHHVWTGFAANSSRIMAECKRGDQQAIERLEPNAEYLQSHMPEGYFLGYRNLTDEPDERAAVVVFAGSRTPENTEIDWVGDQWG